MGKLGIKKFYSVFLILTLLSLYSAAQSPAPSIAIINAKVHTVDEKLPEAEGIAIRENKIVAVGSNEQIRKLIDENTRVIDAKGKLLLPGFNDAHVHFTGIGNQFSSIDLRNVKNPQEVVEKIKRYVRFIPKGRWILGGVWNNENWTPNDLPTKELIDPVTPNTPVFLYSVDANIAWANSAALKIAGIDRDTNVPGTGEIVKDANGEPTGILTGNAILLVRFKAPKLQTKDWIAVSETTTNYAASLGVTSMQDMHSDYLADILLKLQKQGKLKTRVYDCTPLNEWKKLKTMMTENPLNNSMIRVGCLKSHANYFDEYLPVLYENISAADKAGLQVMIHAIGTRANNAILSIYERILSENGARDRRYRVEHAYGFNFEDLARFKNSETIASVQPALFGGNEPYRSFLSEGVRLAFGSDSSMIDLNPFDGIYAAVSRGSFEGNMLQSITVEEAVREYTLGSAYAEFQEDVKGSITVGKYADVIILSQDIFTIPKEKIDSTEVLLTIVDGKIVYEDAEKL